MTTTSADTLSALARLLPDSALITDGAVLVGLSHDEAEWADVGRAEVAVRARSVGEVQQVVTACAELGVPVVTRGAGTGLSGGANAVDGCLVLDLSRMNRVLEIDPDDMIAVVEAGVVNDDLKAAVAAHGLWYQPDPASAPWSTIGGNVATNAGGLCCLKYGVTRDYVLGLRAVVGGPAGYGTAARFGGRTTKGVAGLDMARLVTGSEGTLGVITEITLRLRPAPAAAPRTVVGAFGALVSAGQAVSLITRRGLGPSVLELMDRTTLQAVEDYKHLGLEAEAAALLLSRIDTPGSSGDADAAAVAAAMTDAGALCTAVSTDDAEAEALFEARRLAYPALERLGPVLTEDVCVPKAYVPEMLERIERIAERHAVTIANIAHAGDGNLHPLLITDPGDEDARARAQAAFEDILADALALGGTVTGEHGVGLLKRAGLAAELSPAVLEMHRAVKSALDPKGILNPGKAF